LGASANLFDGALRNNRVVTLRIGSVDVQRWLQINLKHLTEKHTVLVLNFVLTFTFLHFALVICLNMSWLRRLSHVHSRSDSAQPLHMQQMLFNVLALTNMSVCAVLGPHCLTFL
jgi:hypothetical protein